MRSRRLDKRRNFAMMRCNQPNGFVRNLSQNVRIGLSLFVVLWLDVVALRMIRYRISRHIEDHGLLLKFASANLAVEVRTDRCIRSGAANQERLWLALHALEVAELKLNSALREHLQAGLMELLSDLGRNRL